MLPIKAITILFFGSISISLAMGTQRNICNYGIFNPKTGDSIESGTIGKIGPAGSQFPAFNASRYFTTSSAIVNQVFGLRYMSFRVFLKGKNFSQSLETSSAQHGNDFKIDEQTTLSIVCVY